MRGNNLVATLPRLLQLNLMRDFQICTASVDTSQFTMYMLWHRRVHLDPAHRWFREQVLDVAKSFRT